MLFEGAFGHFKPVAEESGDEVFGFSAWFPENTSLTNIAVVMGIIGVREEGEYDNR